MSDVLTALNLHIEQQSKLRYEEKQQFRDALIGGMGWTKLRVLVDPETGKPRIDVEYVDAFEMFMDPYSAKYDLSDALYVTQARWMSMERAQALYPEFHDELAVFTSGFEVPTDALLHQFKKRYVHFNQRRIRLAEQWFRKMTRTAVLVIPKLNKTYNVTDVKTARLDEIRKKYPDAMYAEDIKTEMHMITYIGHLLIEHKVNPLGGNYFPYDALFADRKKDGMPFSIIKDGVPIQEAINKRESKSLHLLSRDRVIFERGAVVTMTLDKLAEELARPDGQIALDGTGKRFEIDKQVDLAVGQETMHREAKSDLGRVTGVNPDARGEKTPIRSGRGVIAKVQQTERILADLFDNLRHTKEERAWKIYQLIKYFYTDEMTFMVTDDLQAPGARPKSYTINQNGQNVVAKGHYDIVVTEMPDFDTMRQEEFHVMTQTLGKIAKAGPMYVRMMLEASDMRQKGRMIEILEEHMKRPTETDKPKITMSMDWNELSKEEKIAWAAESGRPMLAQAVKQGNNRPARDGEKKEHINILSRGR
jgi:hypothetical protein